MPKTRNIASATWRGNRADPVKALGWSLKRTYGISLEDCAILARQGGVCAICLRQPPKRLCIDHCHATAKVRGLLCRTCNVGLRPSSRRSEFDDGGGSLSQKSVFVGWVEP